MLVQWHEVTATHSLCQSITAQIPNLALTWSKLRPSPLSYSCYPGAEGDPHLATASISPREMGSPCFHLLRAAVSLSCMEVQRWILVLKQQKLRSCWNPSSVQHSSVRPSPALLHLPSAFRSPLPQIHLRTWTKGCIFFQALGTQQLLCKPKKPFPLLVKFSQRVAAVPTPSSCSFKSSGNADKLEPRLE